MEAIEDLLFSIGGKAKNVGFKYIVDAVKVTQEDPDLVKGPFRNVYRKVAEMNGKTMASVERSIIHEVYRIYNAGYEMPEFLSTKPWGEKLSAKEFLTRIIMRANTSDQ